MTTLAQLEDVYNEIPTEMRIFTGEYCGEVREVAGGRGVGLWVLLAEDEQAAYEQTGSPIRSDPDPAAGIRAMTSAIEALTAARDRLLWMRQADVAEPALSSV